MSNVIYRYTAIYFVTLKDFVFLRVYSVYPVGVHGISLRNDSFDMLISVKMEAENKNVFHIIKFLAK